MKESTRTTQHIPVLFCESIDGLAIKPTGTYIDGTLGGAGHAEEIAKQLSVSGTFIGCDVDSDAIARAQERLKKFKCIKHLVHGNFRNLDRILAKLGIQQVSGILLDLGWSSFQIADAERGLSFLHDGPLDMNLSKGPSAASGQEFSGERLTAYDIVNFWEEKTLADIFYGYGDETKARVIAKYLVEQRKIQPIATTHQLADLVIAALFKKKPTYFKIHPATKVFQALRIAVNDELQVVAEGIHLSIKYLETHGRLAIITFHSGEDRIVKQMFREYQTQGIVKLVTKKPIGPTDTEVRENPRSRSAKLRIIEKI